MSIDYMNESSISHWTWLIMKTTRMTLITMRIYYSFSGMHTHFALSV
jgi:hypothetical protein